MTEQKGFAALEGLLILVIIAIIGGTGWYVMKAKDNTDKTLSQTANSSAQKSNKAKTSNSRFDLKELGISIVLPPDLKDLTYDAQQITSVSGGKTTALYMSSASFKKVQQKCYGDSTSESFGAIGRAEGAYPADPTPMNSDGALIKQFDKFYISGSYPNGITGCTQPGVDPGLAQSTAHDLLNSLTNAIKTTATED
jgi:hypothetical protein